MSDSAELPKLQGKQPAFVASYIANGCRNATAAAREAGYKFPNVEAARLVTNPKVQKHIQAAMKAAGMSPEEAAYRLAKQGRGSMGDFISVIESGDNEGYGTLDLGKAKRGGNLDLIKKYKRTKKIIPRKDQEPMEVITEEVELYSSQSALSKIADINGMVKRNVDHTSGGKPIQPVVTIDYGLSDDDDADE